MDIFHNKLSSLACFVRVLAPVCLPIVLLLLLEPVFAAFSTSDSYGVGSNPRSVFAADFDGDNDKDLAVANYGSGSISVLFNNGDGTFATAVNYAVGSNPANVFAADLDGDSDLDLAVGNFVSDNVSILLNNGSGVFANAVNYASGDGAWSVFAADLDGDSDLDLAVTNSNASTISVFKNNGDGTFAARVTYAVQNVPAAIHAIDLDGDGDRDLAVANYFGATVSILLNNGDATFVAAVHYEVGNWATSQWNYPIALVAVDLDGDNDADIATANYDNNQVSVLTNNGNGTFTASVEYPVGSRPASIFAAELDNDGDSDLATGNYFGGTVSSLPNNGNGTFAARTDYPVVAGAWSVTAADLDADSDQDFAVTGYDAAKVSILLSDLIVPSEEPAPESLLTIPPLINLKKITDPISLPEGQGQVTYTYRVTNPGRVTVANVSITDDHCNDILFLSGDTNNNTWLETDEEWVYECVTTLSETLLNFTTARGYAHGLVATDASVIQIFVGKTINPPRIHLTKIPEPLLLPVGGGPVTYRYAVTNLGVEPLNDVQVVEDTCSDVKYVEGDVNENTILEPSEAWRYECTTTISETTISTAVATGEANESSAIDPAIAMVLVEESPAPTTAGPYSVGVALENSPTINFDHGFFLPAGGVPAPCVSGSLIKLVNDNNPATAHDTSIYYCGEDGKRHLFPDEEAYFSWYEDYSGVVSLSADVLAMIPIGVNVTHRPGSRMLKVRTIPKVYAVAKGGVLRWVTSEAVAQKLYGPTWSKFVHDMSEVVFPDYSIGPAITSADAVPGSAPIPDPSPKESKISAPKCTSATTFTRSLSLGSIDTEVRALQELLQCLGHFPADTASTGYFGPITEDAVKRFQSAHTIEPLGHVGSVTRDALNRYSTR